MRKSSVGLPLSSEANDLLQGSPFSDTFLQNTLFMGTISWDNFSRMKGIVSFISSVGASTVFFFYPRTFKDGEWDGCDVGFDYAGVNSCLIG